MEAPLPPFRPHFLLPTGHLQTVVGPWLPAREYPYRARRHHVPLKDGDTLVLHDDFPRSWKPGDRAVLMLHGLGGSHRSGQMQRLAGKFRERGIRTFRMDQRGCGAGHDLADRPFHAGRSDDAISAIGWIDEWCPESPLTLIGFSLGANIVLKTAGEVGDLPPGGLDSAIAVAPPIDIVHCAENIWSGWNFIYDRYFAEVCQRHLLSRRRHSPSFRQVRLGRRFRRLIDFDREVTAPLSGFESVEEYYQRSSSGPLLAEIRIPTAILTAADDPVIPLSMFERYRRSDSVVLHVTEQGGHLGYISGGENDPDDRWMEWRIVDWVLGLPLRDLADLPRVATFAHARSRNEVVRS